MKTLRFGFASAAAIAAVIVSAPVGAQDAPRKRAPKVQPSKRPNAKPPKKQPKAAADPAGEEGAPPEEEGGDKPEEQPPEDGENAGTDAPEEGDGSEPEPVAEPSDAQAEGENSEAEADAAGEAEAPAEAEAESGEVESAPRAKKRTSKGKRRRPPAASAAASVTHAPHELEYVDGMDVPDGYAVSRRERKGLIIAGAVTFGVGWLAAVGAAMAANDKEHGCSGGGYDYYQSDHEGAFTCVYGASEEDYEALYVPLIGPFIALRSLRRANGIVRTALIADGVLQVGGAAMFLGGLIFKETFLVRTDKATVAVGAGPGMLQLTGSF